MFIEYSSTTLRGEIDGQNMVYEVSHVPERATFMVFVNGLFRDPLLDNGWYFDGPTSFSMAEALLPGDTLSVAYEAAVVVVPTPPAPTPSEPDNLPPLLSPAQYGLAQANLPDMGNATELRPTITQAQAFALLSDTGTSSSADVLSPTITQSTVI